MRIVLTSIILSIIVVNMQPTSLQFIYTRSFDRSIHNLLSDEDMRAVEQELVENPEAGVMETGTGGIRKIRAAMGERGKSRSARVLYYYLETKGKVYFLLAFAKRDAGTLTMGEREQLKQLAKALRAE